MISSSEPAQAVAADGVPSMKAPPHGRMAGLDAVLSRGGSTSIHLPRGLPGFSTLRSCWLEPRPAPADHFLCLRSQDQPDISFLVLPVPPELRLLAPADLKAVCGELRIEPDDLQLLLMVTVRPGDTGLQAFANLRAPIFVDADRRMAWQVVMPGAGYPIRYPLQAAR